MERVCQRASHELCNTRLAVIAVELDDDDDRCRTFVARACDDDGSSVSFCCALHNYLITVEVHDARLEPDDANAGIVVVVASHQGTVRRRNENRTISTHIIIIIMFLY